MRFNDKIPRVIDTIPGRMGGAIIELINKGHSLKLSPGISLDDPHKFSGIWDANINDYEYELGIRQITSLHHTNGKARYEITVNSENNDELVNNVFGVIQRYILEQKPGVA